MDTYELGMVLRVLLSTDGTVTHIVEAYAGEPVYLVKLFHSLVSDPGERAKVGLGPGERALRRKILLRGVESHVTFVYADSVVMLDRLPPGVAEGLLDSEAPIGRLLYESRAETFREITAMWEERDEHIAALFELGAAEPLVSRTYQIVMKGRPFAWITEKFPKAAFAGPPPAPNRSRRPHVHAGPEGPGNPR